MLTLALTKTDYLAIVYLIAAVLFIFGLKMLSGVKTARRGNLVSASGMLVATVATFFYLTEGTAISLVWIIIAMAIGATAGLIMAKKVPMTGMPQMVGLLNGFGGIASLLVACGDYARSYGFIEYAPWYGLLATGLATLVGGVTFTGSIMAFGKLQGTKWAPDSPVQFPTQKLIIGVLLAACLVLSFVLIWTPTWWVWPLIIAGLALVLGVLLVIGIGGADMPVVVALLNSYSGIAAAFAGFVLVNYALIITGSLVGASGLILTSIMCKAMNRSLLNVLFGGMGSTAAGGGVAGSAEDPTGQGRTAKQYTPEDAAIIMDSAQKVIVVPGYGMAVAQAQHAVKELADELDQKGVTVGYAIHPVAGRMPGHMNVLLAEAGVPYDQLFDLEQANNELETADVAIVLGANDVVNPAARHAKDSPIYGMPILNVDQAGQCFVIKRSMNPGFAGIQNELFFEDNTYMIFGDGKQVVTEITAQVQEL